MNLRWNESFLELGEKTKKSGYRWRRRGRRDGAVGKEVREGGRHWWSSVWPEELLCDFGQLPLFALRFTPLKQVKRHFFCLWNNPIKITILNTETKMTFKRKNQNGIVWWSANPNKMAESLAELDAYLKILAAPVLSTPTCMQVQWNPAQSHRAGGTATAQQLQF